MITGNAHLYCNFVDWLVALDDYSNTAAVSSRNGVLISALACLMNLQKMA